MPMFNDISCDRKGNKEECLANAETVKVLARKFGIGQWSFTGPGSEKKWYSAEENSPQGAWDHIADVNGRHPAPDIHEHFTIHKGYGTLRISSRTTSTILSTL